LQPIENLKAEDLLLSNNTGVTEQWGLYRESNPDLSNVSTRISSIDQSTALSYYKINNGLLNVTGEHAIFVYKPEEDVYVFKAAKNLVVGDVLINGIDKSRVIIENIVNVINTAEVYKINVEPSNTFIANQIIVHNFCIISV
jgi:hypothetical protein